MADITGELMETNAGGLDHIMLHVSDLEASTKFYLKALEPLGYGQIVSMPEAKLVGLGAQGKPDFFLSGDGPATTNFHVAWRGSSEKQVQDFYKSAIEAGGKDNGAPGKRMYHPNYFSAFVLDPDGTNMEVVFHESQ